MAQLRDLDGYLGQWAGADAQRRAVAATVSALASAGAQLAGFIARGLLAGALGDVVDVNAGGDRQTFLDRKANELFLAALRRAPVRCIGSEESREVVMLDRTASLAVAIDPLDGSSNIDTNVSVGTIFSILPAMGEASFFQPGRVQLAAGFIIYGPHTALVFTLGEGTHIATLDPGNATFILTARDVAIAAGKREFAVNTSNYRFWSKPVRAYFDDCIAGADGPRGCDYNMRWIASLVAEAFRILVRGGVFLYPGDDRKGYGRGRLRLVYEAHPIAMVIEQAGGRASDGSTAILDLNASQLHQRTPLVFGDGEEVERIARYHAEPPPVGYSQPLFGRRGLFRV